MRIFKSKWFAKFAQKEQITDSKLREAVRNAEQGIIDADYGGGVIKQRIARTNQGKSSGSTALSSFSVKTSVPFSSMGSPKTSRPT